MASCGTLARVWYCRSLHGFHFVPILYFTNTKTQGYYLISLLICHVFFSPFCCVCYRVLHANLVVCQFIFQLMSGLLAASWLKWSGVVCCFQVLIVSLKLDLRPQTRPNAHGSQLQPSCPAHNLRHRQVVRDWLFFLSQDCY